MDDSCIAPSGSPSEPQQSVDGPTGKQRNESAVASLNEELLILTDRKKDLQQDLSTLINEHDRLEQLRLEANYLVTTQLQPIFARISLIDSEIEIFNRQLDTIKSYLEHYLIYPELKPLISRTDQVAAHDFAFAARMAKLLSRLDAAIIFFQTVKVLDGEILLSKHLILRRQCLEKLAEAFNEQMLLMQREIVSDLNSLAEPLQENSLVDVRFANLADALKSLTFQFEARERAYELNSQCATDDMIFDKNLASKLLTSCEQVYFQIRGRFMPKLYEDSLKKHLVPSDESNLKKFLKTIYSLRSFILNEVYVYELFFTRKQALTAEKTSVKSTSLLEKFIQDRVISLLKPNILRLVYCEESYTELKDFYVELSCFKAHFLPQAGPSINSNDYTLSTTIQPTRNFDEQLFATFGGSTIISELFEEIKDRFVFRIKVSFYKIYLDDGLWIPKGHEVEDISPSYMGQSSETGADSRVSDEYALVFDQKAPHFCSCQMAENLLREKEALCPTDMVESGLLINGFAKIMSILMFLSAGSNTLSSSPSTPSVSRHGTGCQSLPISLSMDDPMPFPRSVHEQLLLAFFDKAIDTLERLVTLTNPLAFSNLPRFRLRLRQLGFNILALNVFFSSVAATSILPMSQLELKRLKSLDIPMIQSIDATLCSIFFKNLPTLRGLLSKVPFSFQQTMFIVLCLLDYEGHKD